MERVLTALRGLKIQVPGEKKHYAEFLNQLLDTLGGKSEFGDSLDSREGKILQICQDERYPYLETEKLKDMDHSSKELLKKRIRCIEILHLMRKEYKSQLFVAVIGPQNAGKYN